MKTVTVNKIELLRALQDNRKHHQSALTEALYRRRVDVRAKLIELIGALDEHQDYQIDEVIRIPLPESHMREYDRAIRMVEMSTENEITLDQREFDQYVMDEWSWKQEFLMKSALYQ